jgi:hypothetical protein
MPRYISPEQRFSVIEDWLNGETREDIAKKHNIGSSTVYNIVQEWSNSIGIEKAEVLRELAILLKKNGLTVFDCAKGFRILNIFKKYGIKEEDEAGDRVTHFLKEIYLKCYEVNLSVQKVFLYIYDILNFSKEISISHIPQYLKEKDRAKRKIRIFYSKFKSKNKSTLQSSKRKRTRNTKIISSSK